MLVAVITPIPPSSPHHNSPQEYLARWMVAQSRTELTQRAVAQVICRLDQLERLANGLEAAHLDSQGHPNDLCDFLTPSELGGPLMPDTELLMEIRTDIHELRSDIRGIGSTLTNHASVLSALRVSLLGDGNGNPGIWGTVQGIDTRLFNLETIEVEEHTTDRILRRLVAGCGGLLLGILSWAVTHAVRIVP